jgi:hypothetical protein
MLSRYFKKVNTFKALLSTNEGKEFLKYLAEEAGAYRPTHVRGDPVETAFNEGKRALFNHIVALTNVSQALIQQQIQAAHEAEQMNQLTQGDNIYG